MFGLKRAREAAAATSWAEYHAREAEWAALEEDRRARHPAVVSLHAELCDPSCPWQAGNQFGDHQSTDVLLSHVERELARVDRVVDRSFNFSLPPLEAQ